MNNMGKTANKEMHKLFARIMLAIGSIVFVLPVSCILAEILSESGCKIFKVVSIVSIYYYVIKLACTMVSLNDELKIMKKCMAFINSFMFFRAIYLCSKLQRNGFDYVDFSNIACKILISILLQLIVMILCIYTKKYYSLYIIILMAISYFFYKAQIVNDINIFNLEWYILISAICSRGMKKNMLSDKSSNILTMKYLYIIFIYFFADWTIW